MIYDRTCGGAVPPFGLSSAWRVGGTLYAARGRIDAWQGVASWDEALDWLLARSPEQPIGEVQFWGHGKWGLARAGSDVLDERALGSSHPFAARLRALGRRMSRAPEPTLWFRTCETLGARRGQSFASKLASELGVRVAGHTFVIWWWQSGLHGVAPGEVPEWDPAEGLLAGTERDPRRAAWSVPGAPNTISCLDGAVPPGW